VTVRAFLCAALGHIAFSATFSAKDAPRWSEDAADVTPDGRFLVFSSQRALTAGEARDEGSAQVYEYDPQTGTLTRVSIGESGSDANDGQNHEAGKTFYAQSFYEYREGHVHLLAGVSAESGLGHAELLGGDAPGSNVFFSTFEARVPEDGDTQLDYYDARVWREGADVEKACDAGRPMAGNAASGRGPR
jgi:hypothetical protein